MKTFLIALLVILIPISIPLAVLNPTAHDLINNVRENSHDDLANEGTGDGWTNFWTGILSVIIRDAVQLNNYVILSTYTFDMSLFRDFGGDAENIQLVGIAGVFRPIKDPQAFFLVC